MSRKEVSTVKAGSEKSGASRRDFLKVAGGVTLTLSLSVLSCKDEALPPPDAAPPTFPKPPGSYKYSGWEDLYREQWTWDKVVKCTHSWANCSGGCEWDVYVKDGIVWREEQTATYPRENDELPDYNPRGCQKGACYSELMYNPGRIKYPLKRVGERGSGKWQRISWDQALTEIADKLIDVIHEYGSDTICHDAGPNYGSGPNTMSKFRFAYYLGAYIHDSWAEIGDLGMGAAMTIGMPHAGGSSSDWFKSDYIVEWMFNPVVTRIPEVHYIQEARYNGSTVVSIAPDYNPSSIHADLWINPEIGTDGALALGAVHVIIRDKLYDEQYVNWQTDLPFLVREDTGRFLRESDMAPDGKETGFYCFDKTTNSPQEMPGTWDHEDRTTDLGSIKPTLEGKWEITLNNGKKVKVTTVFEKIKKMVMDDYSPQQAYKICSVHPDVIEKFAKDFARAERPLIISQWGANKLYHSDLQIRARMLMLSLVGAMGKRGAGFRSIGWYGFESMDLLTILPRAGASGMLGLLGNLPKGMSLDRDTLRFLISILKFRYGRGLPSAKDIEDASRMYPELIDKMLVAAPGVLWTYIHGGLGKVAGKPEYNDPDLPRTVDEYVEESMEKGWMPMNPPRERPPRVWITGGNSILRRLRGWPIMLEHMWPKLKLVIDMNWRVSHTGMYSDYILPVAGWYEKTGMKYPIAMIPFINYSDKAVEPIAESKSEWVVYGLLSKKISERAKDRGVGEFKIRGGVKHDLKKLYKFYTFQNTISIDHEGEEKLFQKQLDFSKTTKGIKLKDLKKTGTARFKGVGMMTPMAQISTDMKENDSVSPSTDFIDRKRPWPTITGRQQYYIDHDWYLEMNEVLPVHKDPPMAGGDYPLMLNGAHARWSIHSMWQDDKYMNRLQRGVPVVHMNPGDTEARGIKDHDYVRIWNDMDEFKINVKICAGIRPGQVMIYHAYEPYQFDKLKSHQVLIPSPMKPLHLAGGYGQLHFTPMHCQPCQFDRETRIEVEKI